MSDDDDSATGTTEIMEHIRTGVIRILGETEPVPENEELIRDLLKIKRLTE